MEGELSKDIVELKSAYQAGMEKWDAERDLLKHEYNERSAKEKPLEAQEYGGLDWKVISIIITEIPGASIQYFFFFPPPNAYIIQMISCLLYIYICAFALC